MTRSEYRCECCGRRLRADEGKACRFCTGRIRAENERLKAGGATYGRSGAVLSYVGTVEGFGRFGSRVLRKAALRGDQLTNPAHRARIQDELRKAGLQDRAMRTLGDSGGGVA